MSCCVPRAPWRWKLPQLLQATREIDRRFLSRLGAFPVDIVIRYEEIAPVRARRMKLLFDAALKILAARNRGLNLRRALSTNYSREDLARLLDLLFRLYAEEVRSLSRSVRLPALLVPLRELIARELLDVMLRVAQPLALEIAAAAIPKAAEDRAPAPES